MWYFEDLMKILTFIGKIFMFIGGAFSDAILRIVGGGVWLIWIILLILLGFEIMRKIRKYQLMSLIVIETLCVLLTLPIVYRVSVNAWQQANYLENMARHLF